jgi:hypothetical protein
MGGLQLSFHRPRMVPGASLRRFSAGRESSCNHHPSHQSMVGPETPDAKALSLDLLKVALGTSAPDCCSGQRHANA